MTPFSDDDLKRLKDEFERGLITTKRDGDRIDEVLEALLARLEAADLCADALDANYQTIVDNSDEDDIAIVDERLKVWRNACGK